MLEVRKFTPQNPMDAHQSGKSESPVPVPTISRGPSLVPNPLCPGQSKHRMRESEIEIGNSGWET